MCRDTALRSPRHCSRLRTANVWRRSWMWGWPPLRTCCSPIFSISLANTHFNPAYWGGFPVRPTNTSSVSAARTSRAARYRSMAATVDGCSGTSRLFWNFVSRTNKPSSVMSRNRSDKASEMRKPVVASKPNNVDSISGRIELSGLRRPAKSISLATSSWLKIYGGGLLCLALPRTSRGGTSCPGSSA